VRSQIFYGRGGEPLRLIAVIIDLTDRKRAEDTLHQREAELVEAQRLARIGSWNWDAESDVVVGSDELLRIFGLDPATRHLPAYREQRGRWYPVEDWKRLKAAIQSTMQTGVSYKLELLALRTGTPIWITARGAVVRNSRNQIVGLRGTVQEITDRKLAEEMLAERNLQLDVAGQVGLVGSYAYDVHTERMQISPGYAAIYGFPDQMTEVTYGEWQAYVHPEDVERLKVLRSETFQERRGEYKADFRIVRRDGETRWIESRGFIFVRQRCASTTGDRHQYRCNRSQACGGGLGRAQRAAGPGGKRSSCRLLFK
jgi:PAS domain-containing protein